VFSLELLNKHIDECRKSVEAGKEAPEELESLIKLRNDLEHASDTDWAAYNQLTDHLPTEDADPVLIILKGQLLIERLVRRFIISRLQNPEAFSRIQLNSAQCIALAESMCLQNKEPEWLWTQVKELNGIRNKLAHKLDDENIDGRIGNFVSTIANAQKMESKTLTSAIARLYGMVKGLCDLAESKEFRALKI